MISKKWLIEQYINNQKSWKEISKLIDVTDVTIGNWLKKYKIPMRSRSNACTIRNLKLNRWQGENNPSIRNPLLPTLASRARGDINGKNNPMFGKKHSEETKTKIRLKRIKPYTRLYNQIRNSQKTKEWSKNVLKRDNYICQICNKRGGNLEADHIISFRYLFIKLKIKTFDEAMQSKMLWELENGRTLCKNCHRKTKNYGGRALKYEK